MIEARGLVVALGGKTIVSGIDFCAPAGAFTAIVGPNGSGKTTLLKALSGEIGYRGTVRINGRDLKDMAAWEAAALRGVLPQSSVLAFPFTVREIVSLGLVNGRSGAGQPDRLAERALDRVDLSGFAGRFYQELSGGEQQRVQLARVLCQVWQPVVDGAPRFLLLDEPVSSLDIRHQIIIMQIARDFAARGGGVVSVLHDLNLTAMFADRVVVMCRGTAAAAGTPAEVMQDDVLSRVFECGLSVGVVPAGGQPFILPQSARA